MVEYDHMKIGKKTEMKNSDFAASNFCDRCGKNEDRVGPRN